MAELVVILGAGASFDCASAEVERDESLRPPLVKDLFAPSRTFARILSGYRLAEMAAADIRTTMAHEAVALEGYLRTRLRDSSDDYARRRYREVPLYLQELLHTVSLGPSSSGYGLDGYTRQPDHYDVLLNLTLPLERVVYVTLNYDTLLDRRIGSYYGGLATLDDYVRSDRNWGLVKLHGSVNWARPVDGGLDADYFQMTRDRYLGFLRERDQLEFRDEIVLRNGTVMEMRYDGARTLFYPSLSAPLGAEDELSCPPAHVNYLREVLAQMGTVNLLVIGYSGLDREVIRLLRESATGVRSMLVVNGSWEASAAGAAELGKAFGPGGGFVEDWVYPEGFGALVRDGRLKAFVDGLT